MLRAGQRGDLTPQGLGGAAPVTSLREPPPPRDTAPSTTKETEMTPKTWGLSKQDARYRPAPKPEVSCLACMWMFPRLARGSCKYVRGVVEGSATCDEFEPRHRGSGKRT